MARLELRAFAHDHVAEAASLLAARHRRHRDTEGSLSRRFATPAEAQAEVASLWAHEHASGAVALRRGETVGFLIGTRRDHETWGANVWIEAAASAADESELLRDLYGFASQRWLDEGRTRHYAVVPALDDYVDAWFRLGFGAQSAHGITEVQPRAWPRGTRRADAGDLERLIALAPLISAHQERAPVSSGIAWDEDEEELRRMLGADIADPEVGELVYEQDGRLVASFEVVPGERASMHGRLVQPERAAYITWAASLPEVRGSGSGLALMDATLAWASEHGYTHLATDWRETNLLSSRFWPARGFRRAFLRVYRSIP